ncbi:hypothetical protein P7C70_g3150, partial [Phenoliferia sp. Uapishka_3]
MTSINTTLPLTHQSLFEAKLAKNITFEAIGKAIGRNEIWVASLFYGQAKPEPADIKGIAEVLGLPEEGLTKALGPHFMPERGLVQMPPTDPLIYRLYEIVMVYGYPLKDVITEKFGDGIMSAIDFSANVEKVHVNGADNVRLTVSLLLTPAITSEHLLIAPLFQFTGKFLSFRKF